MKNSIRNKLHNSTKQLEWFYRKFVWFSRYINFLNIMLTDVWIDTQFSHSLKNIIENFLFKELYFSNWIFEIILITYTKIYINSSRSSVNHPVNLLPDPGWHQSKKGIFLFGVLFIASFPPSSKMWCATPDSPICYCHYYYDYFTARLGITSVSATEQRRYSHALRSAFTPAKFGGSWEDE